MSLVQVFTVNVEPNNLQEESMIFLRMGYRVESPEIIPHANDQLVYENGGKNIQWRKDSLLISGARKTEELHARE